MCAPSRVGAIDPVGMTNASTTKARNTNARMNATRIDSSVSLTLDAAVGAGFSADAVIGIAAGAGRLGGGAGEERAASVGMVANRSGQSAQTTTARRFQIT